MRLFYLVRTHDVSGVSGVGDVAEGVEFSSGKVVLSWRTPITSVAVYDSMDEMIAIHSHDGTTTVRWIE
jgi:hypothetical protein